MERQGSMPEPERPTSASSSPAAAMPKGCSPRADGNFVVPRPKKALPFTGERMTGAIDGQVAIEHFHRYCVARDICVGKDVLDVASGEGYGAALLANVARRVVGVEVDIASVVHASSQYFAANLEFIAGDAQALPLPDAAFDVVVSFETIEHLRNQRAFLGEVRRVLRRDGVFLISVPDRDVYSAPGQPVNRFHVRELSCPEFDELLKAFFAHHCILKQRALIGSVIAPVAEANVGWRSYERRAPDMMEAMPGLSRAFYLIGVASNGPLPRLGASMYSHGGSVEEMFAAKSALRQASEETRRERMNAQAASKKLALIRASIWWRLGAPLREAARRLPLVARQWRRVLKAVARRRAGDSDMRAIFGLPPPIDPVPEPSQVSLPSSGLRPVVSVIIPTFGKVDYTLRCLASIAAAPPRVPIETIVVDDASGDPRVGALEAVRGIRFVLRKENLGFLRSCNDAALLAKGELLMLLNNDTEVAPGAIDALAGLLLQRRDAGMVGARLLYPDGWQQEAGGIIWRDGSAWNYGHRDDPRKPEYCYVREADYVSGAAIMLRRALWNQLGGFDEHFLPAYCEDSDLAFRVRATGLKVFYHPEARVIHHEGVSHGTDIRSGIKAHQVMNSAKLVGRWRDTLRRDHLPQGQRIMRARDRSLRRKITLVVDHHVPEPDRDAGSRTTIAFIEALIASGRVVKFFPTEGVSSPDYAAAVQRRGVEVLSKPWSGGFTEWISPNGAEIDEVLLGRPTCAEACLEPLAAHCRALVVYYGHDLHYARMRLEPGADEDPVRRAAADAMEALERRVWREVDLVLYPSEEEAAAVRALEPGVIARAVPAYALPPPLAPRDPPRSVALIFVAGFLHQPNVDAAVWLVREIMPRIRAAHPDVTLALVGSNPPSSVTALAGDDIEVTGFVSEEELGKRYAMARIAVCPLRFGAGVKLKVVEAMSRGVPVVTTPIGAQGLDGIEAVCDVAKDAEAVAAAVSRLLGDDELWAARSKAAAAFVAERFSPDAVREALDAAFRAATETERAFSV